MKKAPRVLLFVLFLLFGSCNSDFNINAPYQDVYVLNCILRNDGPLQYAIISKNYFTENGSPPAPNSIEQNIQGATIKIYDNDSVFAMRDTTLQLTESGNQITVNCYYVDNLTLNPGNVVRIEATAPDGTLLKSSTQVPNISFANFSRSFPQSYKSGYHTRPNYSWKWISAAGESATILDLPQLEVQYKQYEGGTTVDKSILVPLAFYFRFDENFNLVPVNVKLSPNTSCITTLETVNNAMQAISSDDPYKENYTITHVIFHVLSLNPELSKYYSAYDTYSRDFTIKLRQTDYSNIEGGKGIFGVFYDFSVPLAVDSLYIASFGYLYHPS